MRVIHLISVLLSALGQTADAGFTDTLGSIWNTGASLLTDGVNLIQKAETGDYKGVLKQLNIISNETDSSLVTTGDTPMDVATAIYKALHSGGIGEALQAVGIVPNLLEEQLVRPNDSVQSRCYPSMRGCFRFTPGWYHPQYRKLNAFPQKPEEVNVRFLVGASSGQIRTEGILEMDDDESYMMSGFNVSKSTVVYIHGFQSSPDDNIIQRLTRKLVAAEQGSLNVLTVSWKQGSNTRYTQAIGNTLLVAQQTKRMLTWLQERHGFQLRRVHLVGHSLGAHIAGYVGTALKGIGRITGLDPAKPGFENMPPEVRLDSTDALFVDVLHTDVGNDTNNGWGTRQPSGHVDIYVNGGVDQPGCSDPAAYVSRLYDKVIGGTGEMDIACRHNRAIKLFIDSIEPNEGCQFVAHECKSYQEYLEGSCSTCGQQSHCSTMGYHASRQGLGNRSNVKLYLTTGRQAPFCLSPYSIKITLSKPVAGSPAEFHGRLRVTVMAARSGILEVTLPINYQETNTIEQLTSRSFFSSIFTHMVGTYSEPDKRQLALREGNSYGFLLRSQTALGEVSRISVTWLPEYDDRVALLKRGDRLPLAAELTLQDMSSMHGSRQQLFYASDDQPGVKLTPHESTHFYSQQ